MCDPVCSGCAQLCIGVWGRALCAVLQEWNRAAGAEGCRPQPEGPAFSSPFLAKTIKNTVVKHPQAPILQIPCPLPIRITSWEQWKGSLHGVIGEMSLELCFQFAAHPHCSQCRWCCAVSYAAVGWGHGPEPGSSGEAAAMLVGVLGAVQSCHCCIWVIEVR